MTYAFRDLRLEDAAPLGALHLRCWHQTYVNAGLGIDHAWIAQQLGFVDSLESVTFRQAIVKQLADVPHAVLYKVVASEEGIKGFLHATTSGDTHEAVLEGLYLLNELKGTGTADQFMVILRAWTQRRAIRLEVVEYNERARRFYGRHGFQLTGKRTVWKEIVPVVEMLSPALPR